MIGLVLSGGGVKGAYQVGSYLLDIEDEYKTKGVIDMAPLKDIAKFIK